MQFLADESCDHGIVRAVRAAGHEVLAVSETGPGATDEDVLQMAASERRMLLIEDKDFGQWVYAERRATGGVILLRYPSAARLAMQEAVVRVIARHDTALLGCFVVVQLGRVRIRRPPAD